MSRTRAERVNTFRQEFEKLQQRLRLPAAAVAVQALDDQPGHSRLHFAGNIELVKVLRQALALDGATKPGIPPAEPPPPNQGPTP